MTTGDVAASHGRPHLTPASEHDDAWLTAARWLSLIVQVGLLTCLVVALRAGWQLNEALRWNERLAQQAEAFSSEAMAGAASAGAGAVAGVVTGEAASVVAGQVGSSGRAAPRQLPVAPVWADDVASAAFAAATAASAAAAAPQSPAWLTDGSPPQWRFAQGLGMARQGDLDSALARYRSVFDDPALGNLARYNSANTLLREAMRLSATAAPGQALVLFELAKEGYRGVLRRDPSFWAARYNLERALQLQPDGETVAAEPAQQAERAATTMRSVSRGLP
jgi:mxaK protein